MERWTPPFCGIGTSVIGWLSIQSVCSPMPRVCVCEGREGLFNNFEAKQEVCRSIPLTAGEIEGEGGKMIGMSFLFWRSLSALHLAGACALICARVRVECWRLLRDHEEVEIHPAKHDRSNINMFA